MTTKQRTDLQVNIPALRKLDAMLLVSRYRRNYQISFSFILLPFFAANEFYIGQLNSTALKCWFQDCLDNFKDQNEFYYVSKDDESEKGAKKDDKWWVPSVKVPPNGLSELTKKWLLFQKDSVTQVLKAAMAINAQILSEMEIPENYIDSLPKV